STTDPDARLFRKGSPGKEAKLCHMGHIMMENRHGLIVDARLTEANGAAEREAALEMIKDNASRGSTIAPTRITMPPTSWPVADNKDACRGSEQQAAPLGNRCANHPSCWLQNQPDQTQADRGTFRLDEDRGHPAQDKGVSLSNGSSSSRPRPTISSAS